MHCSWLIVLTFCCRSCVARAEEIRSSWKFQKGVQRWRRNDKLCTRLSSRATNTSVLVAYISYKKLRYTFDKSVGKFDRRVLFSCAHVPGCNFFGFFEIFFLTEGDIGLCGFRQLGCFGNFNFKLRYCSILRTCGIRCFIVLDGILIKNYSPGLYIRISSLFQSLIGKR